MSNTNHCDITYKDALAQTKLNIHTAQTLQALVDRTLTSGIQGRLELKAFVQDNTLAMREVVRLGRIVSILEEMGKVFLRRGSDQNKALAGYVLINANESLGDPHVTSWVLFERRVLTHGDVWDFFQHENDIAITALKGHPQYKTDIEVDAVTFFGCLRNMPPPKVLSERISCDARSVKKAASLLAPESI